MTDPQPVVVVRLWAVMGRRVLRTRLRTHLIVSGRAPLRPESESDADHGGEVSENGENVNGGVPDGHHLNPRWRALRGGLEGVTTTAFLAGAVIVSYLPTSPSGSRARSALQRVPRASKCAQKSF